MRNIVFVLLSLLTILSTPAAPSAQLSEVRVGVDGMTCVT